MVRNQPGEDCLLPPSVPLPDHRSQHVPPQSVAAAAVVNQMTPAAGANKFTPLILPAADGSGARNQGQTRPSGKGSVEGDLMIPCQLPGTEIIHHLRRQFPDPRVADARRADAHGGAHPCLPQKGGNLLQKSGKPLLPHAVEIEGTEGLPA